MWDVIDDPDYRAWFEVQAVEVRDAIVAAVIVLSTLGPQLGRPLVDTLKGSRLPNLKELRVRCQGDPYRILFAFDPARRAILLVGGNKGGDKRWYKVNIPIAEARYAHHLADMAEKGEIP